MRMPHICLLIVFILKEVLHTLCNSASGMSSDNGQSLTQLTDSDGPVCRVFWWKTSPPMVFISITETLKVFGCVVAKVQKKKKKSLIDGGVDGVVVVMVRVLVVKVMMLTIADVCGEEDVGVDGVGVDGVVVGGVGEGVCAEGDDVDDC